MTDAKSPSLFASASMPSRWTTCLAIVSLSVVGVGTAWAEPPERLAAFVNQPVQLLLDDGRTPCGVLSPVSDADWYVLLTELPGIRIESRFAARIVHSIGTVAGQTTPKEKSPELRVPPPPEPAAPQAGLDASGLILSKSETAPTAHQSESVRTISGSAGASPSLDIPIGVCDVPTCAVEIVQPDLSELVRLPMDPVAMPRSLRIESRVASWDPDRAIDGLLIRILPLNAWGQIVPVEGQLDLQLLTETQFATGGRTVSRYDRFQVAERWSVPVHAVEFDTDGMVYRLPFRRIQPERDLDIAPDALLIARLRVPSAGAFDAVDPFVRLRSTSRALEDYFLKQDPHRPSGHR